MRLRTIHVSRYAPVVPSLWVDTAGTKPVLKAYVNGRYQTLSGEIPAGILTQDMIVNSLDSDAVDLPLSAAQGKILKNLLDEKQTALTPGTGIEITEDNTINVTLDTTVFKVVPSLPDSPASEDMNKIHLVPSESTGENNSYKEYLWVNGKWEEIGTYVSTVDLAPYLSKEDAGKTYQKITDSSLQTQDKTVVGGINEVLAGLEEVVKPYVINLTNLLAAQDSESISAAIGGIDNLNGTVQKNQVIFGTLANGTVAVGIRVLGNQTTLTYFVDSVVGLTVNEVIITNTSGTLTKTANTHAVLTENMVVDSLDSDETTLPLSAAQGKVLNEKIQSSTLGVYYTNALLAIDFTSSSLTDDDINQYIGSWEGLVNAIQTSTPIYDKVALVGSSGSQYSLVPVVAGMSTDNAVDMAMFVGVDNTYRQIKILKVADNNYTLVSAKKVILDNDNNAALLTDNKTITGAINENLTLIRKLDKAAGQPVVEDVDFSAPETGYVWRTDGNKAEDEDYNIKYVSLSKGDLIVFTTNAGPLVVRATLVDSLHNRMTLSIQSDISGITTGTYLATKDCIVALSYMAAGTHSAYIVKSSQNTAIADIAASTAALHKVYESYGAVYNKETGYWELNGLTDLTEEDMWDIYLAGVPKTENLTEFYAESTIANKSIRTTFNCLIKGSGTGTGAILRGAFMQCANLEVVQFYKSKGSIIYASELYNAFYNCQKLREIAEILTVYRPTLLTTNMFYNCKALESVKLGHLGTDISFKDSPLLSYESIKYLVDNAANTAAITVTVHPTTYSYLTGTAQPTVEVGGTTDEWQALVTTAQGKQISFAVPEETQSEVTE